MNKYKKTDIIMLIIVIILINTYILIKLFSIRSEPVLLEYAKMYATNAVTMLINNAIKKELYSDDSQSFIEIVKDNDGNIASLNMNNSEANKILYDITNDLLQEFDTKYQLGSSLTKNNIYYIPFGIINNANILSNIGPKIPYKIYFVGGINNKVNTNIREYGINSYIVEIVLNIDLQMEVLLPFKSNTIVINKDIILDSKVVHGQIPKYYGGITYSSLK